MKKNKETERAFQSALSGNAEAVKFYESCTQSQKSGILNQAKQIDSPQRLQDFIEHLPSATL